MTYKELLKICIENPGSIQTKEQNITDSNIRYQNWLKKSNEDYLKEKNQNQ